MPYYIRVLSISDSIVPASVLAGAVPNATLNVEAGTDGQWDELLMAHGNGREIALIERNPVTEGSMAAEELEEFVDELDEIKPASGAEWLRGYLPRVKTIYAFQILSGSEDADGWDIIGAVKAKLWNAVGGIFQADGEGFSNEDGYQIVWQFSNRVSGPWSMGLSRDSGWIHFQMDLGNIEQREAFLRGNLPDGVTLAK